MKNLSIVGFFRIHACHVFGALFGVVALSGTGCAQVPPAAERAAFMKPLPDENVRAMVPSDVVWMPNLTYREGNEAWTLDLAMPADTGAGPRPAVVIVHGGGWVSGDKRTRIFARYPIEYAKKGFVSISINYRLAPDNTFPAQIEDVKTAIRWLRAHAEEYNVDPDRIGIYGNSAGAHLAVLAALAGPEAGLEGDGPYQEYSSAVQAALGSATPTDLTNWRDGAAMPNDHGLFDGDGAAYIEQARLASPIHHVEGSIPAILLMHGTDDETVPYEQSVRLASALQEAGAADVALHTFEGGDHAAYMRNTRDSLPMSFDFFARTLGLEGSGAD